MRFYLLILVAVALAFSSPVYAQDEQPAKVVRPYVALKIGPSFMKAGDIKNTSDTDDPATPSKDDESGTVVAGGIAAGIRIAEIGRVEVEGMWRSGMDYDPDPAFKDAMAESSLDGTLSSTTVFLNYFYDFRAGQALRPYIGVGLGLAINKTEAEVDAPSVDFNESDSDTRTDFAWNVGLGAAYSITDHIWADLGWRYADLGKAEWSTPNSYELTSKNLHTNEVLLSVRYEF